jgi:hypothetical protein
VKKNDLRGQLTLFGAALALLFGYASAQAAELASANTYIVTTNGDDPTNVMQCSGETSPFICMTLRDAINQANGDETGPTINFAITDTTITLLASLPNVNVDPSMTIDGTSQNITVSGAGLYPVLEVANGALTINALTIANGSCTGECYGGGAISVLSEKSSPSLIVSNSTFYGNSGTSAGAIYCCGFGGVQMTIVSSTFYGNSATAGGGGAISTSGPTTVTNSTFSHNTSTAAGSAIATTGSVDSSGTVVLTNTILAAEGAASSQTCAPAPDDGSPFTDNGGNLSDDSSDSCNLGEGPNENGYYPDTGAGGLNLGTLANYGGPTETIALLPSSAAISSAVVGNCPAEDQRGVTRPMSDGVVVSCSSGALQFPVFSTTTSSTGTASECTAPAVCNLSGGDSQTVAAGTTTAAGELAADSGDTITENLCTFPDPRKICGAKPNNSGYYNQTTFPVSKFCGASFGNTVVPDYLCGAYGSSGPTDPAPPNNQLAVLQGISDPVNDIAGLLWLNDANPDVYFGFNPMGAPECNSIGLAIYPNGPQAGQQDYISVAWAPWSGSAVEGSIPVSPRAAEVTDGCGGGKNPGPGVSITLIGVALNLSNATQELGPGVAHLPQPAQLVEFAEFKYANLFLDVAEANIPLSNKAHLEEIVIQSGLFLAAGNHKCAETTLYDADNYVINNASVFLGNSVDPNSYGRTRTWLLNLFYTLYTRLDMQPNPITNLAVSVPFPLLAPGFTPPVCSQSHL